VRLLISGATATLRNYPASAYLGHLLVPGAGNSMRDILSTGFPWAADNAAFSGFDPGAFAGLLGRIAGQPGCLFVACPDVVCDARATLQQFDIWQPILRQLGVPVALVGQDELENLNIPWDRMQALFLGGSTAWKLSTAAAALAREAKTRGCWIHMGRCNSHRRLRHAYAIGCDSVDGSSFSRWPDHHIPRALHWLAGIHDDAAAPETDNPARRLVLPLARQVGSQWLDLPGWIVDKAHRLRAAYRLSARYVPEPSHCLRCGAGRLLARGPRRHGVKRQQFRDLPQNGKPVTLVVNRVRYRCLACQQTFLQPLPDMVPNRSLTQRLLAYVLEQSAASSCSAIAREIGVDEKTVRNLAAVQLCQKKGRHSRKCLPKINANTDHNCSSSRRSTDLEEFPAGKPATAVDVVA
jgi:transposase-like protein